MTLLAQCKLAKVQTISLKSRVDFTGSQRLRPHASSAGGQGADLVPGQGNNGEGDGTPLQYSCLENPMDGGTAHSLFNTIPSAFQVYPLPQTFLP